MPEIDNSPEALLSEAQKEALNKQNKRAAYISALRELADIFEASPEIPAPVGGTYVYIGDCTAEQLAAATRLGYRAEKRYSDDHFSLRINLGEHEQRSLCSTWHWKDHAIMLTFAASREQVCEKVVVGKKYIPEEVVPAYVRPAREEEVVEWRCKPLLGGAEEEL